QSLSLPELIEHVLHHSGLLTHYLNDKEGADRIENLKELVNAAAMFAAEENMEGLPAGVAVQMPGVGAEPSDTADDPFGLAAGGPGCDPADDCPRGEGAGVRYGVRYRPGRGSVPA